MTTYRLKNQIFTLLFISVLFVSCKGQVKTVLPKEPLTGQISFTSRQPKLIKTQGSDQHVITRCGLQDKSGNLWFGTTGEGAYRFDGKDFTQFTKNDGLLSNKIWSILEDKSGNIWFGTTDGISRFDGEKIVSVPIPFSLRPAVNNDYYNEWSTKNTVWSMLQDDNGTIWFGTGDGVYCYKGNNFTRFLYNDWIENNDRLSLKMVDCMIEDRNGNIWFASGMLPGQEGLCRYDGKTIIRFNPGGDGWIRCVLEDKNGIIWSAGRHQGNWCYDGKIFIRFTGKTGIGSPMLADKAGNIWFSGEEHPNGYESNGGVWCYDGKSFKNFNTEDGLGNFGVWSVTEDSAGNIWVGTKNCGLYKYDGKTFTSFSE